MLSIQSGRLHVFVTHRVSAVAAERLKDFSVGVLPGILSTLQAFATPTLSYTLIFSLLSLIMMSVGVRGQPSRRLINRGPYLSAVSDRRSTCSVYFGLIAMLITSTQRENQAGLLWPGGIDAADQNVSDPIVTSSVSELCLLLFT